MPWLWLGPRLRSHLTLGVALGIAAAALFALLACAVAGVALAGLTQYDISLNALLRGHAQQAPRLADFFGTLTDLGDVPFLTLISILVLLVLTGEMLRHGQHRALTAFWIVGTAGAMWNFVLKDIFQRSRPEVRLVDVGGWSFPSGHSMGSLIVYGMLAYVLVVAVRDHWAKRAMVAMLVILVGAIGFSRVYLGAHWPTDVLAGYAAGTAWLAGCITASETLRRRREDDKVTGWQGDKVTENSV